MTSDERRLFEEVLVTEAVMDKQLSTVADTPLSTPSEASTEAVEGVAAGLTFAALRQANLERLPQFRNKHGEPAHSEPDGSDWSPAQWLQATLGELGEYANLRKKFERGDLDEPEFLREAADELADVQTYLDILAFRLGIDLGAATVSKWNRISERVGCAVRLKPLRIGRMRDVPDAPTPTANEPAASPSVGERATPVGEDMCCVTEGAACTSEDPCVCCATREEFSET